MKKYGPLLRTLGSFLFLFCFASCVSYRVVKLGPGVGEDNIVSPFYAVARNNVVIPEYVVDRYGNYPTTTEDAEKRFQLQRYSAEPLVREKYYISSNPPGQLSQYVFGFCLSLVSPVVVPIQWIGETFSSIPGKKRSFSQIASDYFALCFHSPLYEKPQIRERVDYFY